MTNSNDAQAPFTLSIQRIIAAQPERVFRAWTNPVEMKNWWGPQGVRCLSVEIDLQPGGQYRIENELPDKSVLWIGGEFETVEPPDLLVYTWVVETDSPTTERVTVKFVPHDQGTEILLTHELIPDHALSKQHQQGWYGCLDGLGRFLGD